MNEVIALIVNTGAASGKNKTGQLHEKSLLSGLVEKRQQMSNQIIVEIDKISNLFD